MSGLRRTETGEKETYNDESDDRRRPGIRPWILCGLSILLAAIIALTGIWCVWGRRKDTYQVVLLGDSMIGSVSDGKGVAACLEELLGVSVLKGGFGGTTAAYVSQTEYPSEASPQLSLAKLSRAIVLSDFSVQKSLIAYGDHYEDITDQTVSYFSETIRALSQTDFGQVEYLVIEHGTNDYNEGVTLDNPENPYDETTFGGALRSAIERLQEAYPGMQIILMTPTWCYITQGETLLYCNETDFGGGYLEDYVELELAIAEVYGLPVLDNYHESGIGEDTAALYLSDGLHLNSLGQELIAERLAELIRTLAGNVKG